MSRMQKILLAGGIVLLILAEVVKRVPMSQRTTVIVGAIEVLLAIAIGSAFGLTATKNNH
jgi:hypothetical protein